MSGFPTGVVVVTAHCLPDDPCGLTCSSLISVTLQPPTLLISIKSGSPVLSSICQSGLFAVNLLHAKGERAARIFSSPIPERFSQVKWRATPNFRLPWLFDDAFAVAECELSETHEVGDHVLTMGRVARIEQSTCPSPLLYGKRQFAAWPATEGQF
ncbi:flavin reductase family protein [Streptomyces olivaceus]